MKMFYYIALSKDWKSAQATGFYVVGSLHRSFDEDGFIHLAHASQINVIADLIYRDTLNLLLLTIDPEKLHGEVKEEMAEYPAELFPHLYGPLNVDAVTSAEPYIASELGFPKV